MILTFFSLYLKIGWEDDLGIQVSETGWDKCLLSVYSCSINSGIQLIQYKVHRLHYSKPKCNMMSPLYLIRVKLLWYPGTSFLVLSTSTGILVRHFEFSFFFFSGSVKSVNVFYTRPFDNKSRLVRFTGVSQ